MSARSVPATGSTLPQQETEQTPGGVGRDDDRSGAALHPPLTAADRRAIEHLVTEDDTPVHNRFPEKRRRLLTSPPYSSWAGPGGGRPSMVCADIGVFLHPRAAPLVPDAFPGLDLNDLQEPWAKEGRSYFIWEYKKAPDVVIEVVSNEKGGEMAGKYARYAWFGVPLCVVFDPLRLVQEEAVQAWQRTPAAAYRPCGYDLPPGIGLVLRLWQGRFENLDATRLRWQDTSGDPVPTGGERADRARTRAGRLAALLRAHGISPDNGTIG